MPYREAERGYYEVMMPAVRRNIEEFKKEIGNYGKCLMLECLYDQLWEYEAEINQRYELYKALTNEDAKYIEKDIVSYPIASIEKRMDSIKMRIRVMIANAEGKFKNTITPEMIMRAREYPITELLGGQRKGNYLCINHPERHPSMGVKNNRARCFSCDWTGDSIDVAMLLWSCDFIDTIRRLQ